jgi:hypothetical protein
MTGVPEQCGADPAFLIDDSLANPSERGLLWRALKESTLRRRGGPGKLRLFAGAGAAAKAMGGVVTETLTAIQSDDRCRRQ